MGKLESSPLSTTLPAGPVRTPRAAVKAVRRAGLGSQLLWRRFFVPASRLPAGPVEIRARQAAWTERQLAAERYHAALIESRCRQRSSPPPEPHVPARTAPEHGPADRAPHPGESIIFLNFTEASAGTVQGRTLKRDYVLACRFLHCSIMDRTGALDQGFAYAAIDPIPRHATCPHSFAELCDTIGAEIVDEALLADKTIAVLWSGGIDSTSALIAVIKAAGARGCMDRIQVCLSLDSVSEYPGFFLNHICGRLRIQPITRPMSAFLDPAALNVTGEHGDQLFGSQLLRSYVQRGFGQVAYEDVLGAIMVERLGNPWSARRVRRYLEPVIAAAPVPIRTVFDYLWWLNYTLKWQSVTLRLAVSRGDQTYPVYRSLRHFFRDERFQRWALASTPGRTPAEWPRYKDIAKQYILDFTGDASYFTHKEKQDSLRNVLLEPQELTNHLVFMREDFRPLCTLANGSKSTFWNKEPRSHATIHHR